MYPGCTHFSPATSFTCKSARNDVISFGERGQQDRVEVNRPHTSATRQAESGTAIADVCRQLGVSEATFYLWRKKFAHLGISELRRLRLLEDEHARLKRVVADLTLDTHMLAEAFRKKGSSRDGGGRWRSGSSPRSRPASTTRVGSRLSVTARYRSGQAKDQTALRMQLRGKPDVPAWPLTACTDGTPRTHDDAVVTASLVRVERSVRLERDPRRRGGLTDTFRCGRRQHCEHAAPTSPAVPSKVRTDETHRSDDLRQPVCGLQ